MNGTIPGIRLDLLLSAAKKLTFMEMVALLRFATGDNWVDTVQRLVGILSLVSDEEAEKR